MEIIENGLIPIYQGDNQDRLVDARELHEFMEVETKFADWIKRRIEECGLAENTDYVRISQKRETPTGFTTIYEYALTLDTAKHISMLERNEKGKQARQYFIEVEKKAKNPVAMLGRRELAQMVLQAEIELEQQKAITGQQAKEIKALVPKAEVYDQFIAAENAINIGTFAKVIKWGPNKLFKHLRQSRILFQRKGENLPYQDLLDRDLFQVKTTPVVINGKVENKSVTLITPKGQEWLYKFLNKSEGTLA